jgi:predicted TPR repeat methyltransferase
VCIRNVKLSPMPTVSEQLSQHYASYYSRDIAEWRKLGAVDKVANIRKLCADIPHARIVELGCGDGSVMDQLQTFGSVTGYDISQSGVDSARAKGLDARLYDGHRIEDRYDLAVLTHVVEHLEHPRQLLYTALEIANHVFVEVPLEDNARLGEHYNFDPVGHINFYSPKTIRLLLETCGLKAEREVITQSSLPLYKYRLGRKGVGHWLLKGALLNLLPGLATRTFTYHYSAVCRKA